MLKRAISLLLSMAVVLSLMPANFHAFAEEIPAEEVVAEAPVETTPEEILAIQETVPVEEAESYDAYGTILLSGRCGDNLSWYLYSHGELVISGWGPMDDYTYNTMPWNIADNRSKIKTITIEYGVTSIGNYAFAACPNLTSVTMPSTVTSIGNAAFNACSSLYVLDIGKNVATIGRSAFSNCSVLTQVTLGDALTSIGDYAFDSTRLMDLVFPKTLTSIGNWVFLNCYGLKSLSFKGNAPSFGSGTFSHFYGKVYYRANDSTWTENVRQNYDGEVEWIASDPVIISGGTCGTNAKWNLTEDGTLTISGTGVMNDYPLGYIPWNEHQRDIKNVVVEKGITGSGSYAFRNCYYLTNLVVPESVTNISASAFDSSSIREITFEGDAPTFGENAFKGKTITVHYPANNATWTEAVRQNYGGKITWKLYCPDEHTEVIDKAVEATCTTDGLTEGKHCSVCNEVIVAQEVVPALGHSTVEVPGVEPTVDAAGNIPHFSCEVCGKLFAEAEAETELKPEDVVLDKLPCGAMVGGSHYGTVEQALAAAKPGDVVTLTADAVAGNLFVPVGVTLDLAEYSLTADYLFGVKGTFLTGTPEKAKLMVPKDNVILAQDGYVNAKGQYVLPIWDPASNCFQFSLFVVNTDTSKKRGLKINEAAEEIRFQFKHQATSNLNSLLLADGASDNEMSIVIRLSWTNDQGTAHQDFVYNDNQVAKVTGSYDYTFVLTGYSALNINLDTLVVQAMVITNSGATAFGTAWTQQMLK